MGNWGCDILDGDTEMDIFDDYRGLRDQGLDGPAADAVTGTQWMSAVNGGLADLVISVVQIHEGRLDQALGQRVVDLIERRDPELFWTGRARNPGERAACLMAYAALVTRALAGDTITEAELPEPLGGWDFERTLAAQDDR